MFNKKGESQMDKTILVVEVSKYSWGTSYTIKKHADSLDKASEYLVSLKNLNDNNKITYELFNRFGQFEVDRTEKVKEVVDEISF
jgi:hypothetical protein